MQITLKSGQNSVTINQTGSIIEELIINNTKILGRFTRIDNKSAASHPCTPIFGLEKTTNFSLPRHGSARNQDWTIIDQTNNFLTLELKINDGQYPKGLIAQQKFDLTDNNFSITTTHQNLSSNDLPVRFGEHLYWNTPKGWDDLKINNQPVSDLVKKDTGFIWPEKNIIEISGQPKIRLIQKNLNWVQLWTAQNDNQFDNNYVCIEPAQDKPVQIQPNQIIKSTITIALA